MANEFKINSNINISLPEVTKNSTLAIETDLNHDAGTISFSGSQSSSITLGNAKKIELFGNNLYYQQDGDGGGTVSIGYASSRVSFNVNASGSFFYMELIRESESSLTWHYICYYNAYVSQTSSDNGDHDNAMVTSAPSSSKKLYPLCYCCGTLTLVNLIAIYGTDNDPSSSGFIQLNYLKY